LNTIAAAAWKLFLEMVAARQRLIISRDGRLCYSTKNIKNIDFEIYT
jgi:hypothetical protein